MRREKLIVFGIFLLASTTIVGVGNEPTPDEKGGTKSDVYQHFNAFCKKHFGAEKEPLVYQTYGDKLTFVKDGEWSHVSENSAVIAWETNLPATSYLEYGDTEKYGKTTPKEERPFYRHIHYLKDLQTGKSYHVRLVSIDERGNKLTSKDRLITPKKIDGAIYVPGDLQGPSYRLDKSKYYVLTEDIDAEVTGIDIAGSNLTFDLNGHTITYDTSKTGYEKVKGTRAYTKGFGPEPNGGPHGVRGGYGARKGARVLNGFIRQGKGGHGGDSAPIAVSSWAEVAGVTMSYHGPQVRGVTGWVRNLHHCVFVDRGTVITNRHQGTSAIEIGLHSHHNLIKRTRHRGIDAVRNGKVYNNEIYVDSFATNGFGVFHYKTRNAICNHNRIFGTGYHFIGIGTTSRGVGNLKVKGNFIHGRTLEMTAGRSREYGDQSGVNGLRLTWGGENIEWTKNVVVVEGRGSGKGEVRGVWHSPDPNQSELVYHDNIFKAVADPEKKMALGAVVISGSKYPEKDFPGLFRNNVIISNFCNVSLGGQYYGDGTNGRFVGNTFVRIGDRKDYRTIQGGIPWGKRFSAGHVFIDSHFKGGAGRDKVKWRGDGEFAVGWTVTIRTKPGADVAVKDRTGQQVFNGKADAKGLVRATLMQFRHYERGKIMLTPHTITVRHNGKTVQRTITVDRTQVLKFIFR